MICKVKNYIKYIRGIIWAILPISAKQKALFQYKWRMLHVLRYLRRDVSLDMRRELEKEYKNAYSAKTREAFETRARDIQKKYKKIHILRNNILNIGPLCYIYYLLREFLEDCPVNEKVVFFLYDGDRPVYVMSDSRISNQWLLSKIRESVEVIDQDTAPFWGYFLKKYETLCTLDNLDDVGRILHLNRALILHKENYDYPSRRLLCFSDSEKQYGESMLKKMGIKRGAYFCFFSRNNEYHEEYFNNHGTHQAMLTKRRNSSVDTFVQAITSVPFLDIKAVRVGAVDSRKVDGRNILDYTNTYRDEFLDFFIMSEAKFFVGDDSGVVFIPWLLNIPQAITNNFSFFWRGSIKFNYNSKMNLTIFKKWWDHDKKRYLTLREILNLSWEYGITDEMELDLYSKLGIEFHSNTSEEIADLIYEMNLRIEGRWKDDNEMRQLREKYWTMINAAVKRSNPVIVLWDYEPGSLFLKKNKWLLD